MESMDLRKGARSDPNAYFVGVRHVDTAKLIDHLRAHRVKFSVDVEPDPPEDQSDDDIFWFESSSDVAKIQKLIYEVVSKPSG